VLAVDFNSGVHRLHGLSFDAVTMPGSFETLRRDSAHRMSVCFFGGPEERAESACQKLNTEGGSALAFHEEPR